MLRDWWVGFENLRRFGVKRGYLSMETTSNMKNLFFIIEQFV